MQVPVYSTQPVQVPQGYKLVKETTYTKRKVGKKTVTTKKTKKKSPSYLAYLKQILASGKELGSTMMTPYAVGSAAGMVADKLFGKGAYKLAKNSLLTGKQVPFMHSMKDGVRIRHREYIQDVTSSTTFTNTVYSINPGLTQTFPWLSGIAQNFEQYRFEGLMFEFKSTSADALNSTNTALGTVVMAAEYNTTQAAYVNKQQMENSMWATSSKPAENQCNFVECLPQNNTISNLYIRLGAIAANQDIRMYDLANMQIATVGSQAAANVGELWVTYDVVLLKPQLASGLDLSDKWAHYTLTAPAVTTDYFGTSRTVVNDNIGMTFTGTVATFPIGLNGNFLVSYSASGASTALTSPTFTLANCIAGPVSWTPAGTAISNTGTTSTIYMRLFSVKISDPSLAATITLSGGTLCATPTSGDFIVTQIDGDSF